MTDELSAGVREVLNASAGLKVDANTLGADADLFAAGMNSLASVEVMLGLEDRFAIMFPEDMLQRSVFASIDAMVAAITEIRRRAEG